MSTNTLAGSYRLETSPELVEFIERTFVTPVPPETRAQTRSEALHEMEGAELVLEPDGTLVSRSHGRELLRAKLDLAALESGPIAFDKAPDVRVTLERVGPDTLLSHQAGKPPLRFRRA